MMDKKTTVFGIQICRRRRSTNASAFSTTSPAEASCEHRSLVPMSIRSTSGSRGIASIRRSKSSGHASVRAKLPPLTPWAYSSNLSPASCQMDWPSRVARRRNRFTKECPTRYAVGFIGDQVGSACNKKHIIL